MVFGQVTKIVFLNCKSTAKPHLKFVPRRLCSGWWRRTFPRISCSYQVRMRQMLTSLGVSDHVFPESCHLLPEGEHAYSIFFTNMLPFWHDTCVHKTSVSWEADFCVFHRTWRIVNQWFFTWLCGTLFDVQKWLSDDVFGASRNRSERRGWVGW